MGIQLRGFSLPVTATLRALCCLGLCVDRDRGLRDSPLLRKNAVMVPTGSWSCLLQMPESCLAPQFWAFLSSSPHTVISRGSRPGVSFQHREYLWSFACPANKHCHTSPHRSRVKNLNPRLQLKKLYSAPSLPYHLQIPPLPEDTTYVYIYTTRYTFIHVYYRYVCTCACTHRARANVTHASTQVCHITQQAHHAARCHHTHALHHRCP